MKSTKDMTFSEMATELDALRWQALKPVGPRAILVVDRGWIFAGDATETADGHIRLDRAVHVFRWESIGFAKMIEDWKSPKVDLRSVAPVEVPKGSVIFRVPVSADWGTKQ
jgi:hypothetical protein